MPGRSIEKKLSCCNTQLLACLLFLRHCNAWSKHYKMFPSAMLLMATGTSNLWINDLYNLLLKLSWRGHSCRQCRTDTCSEADNHQSRFCWKRRRRIFILADRVAIL